MNKYIRTIITLDDTQSGKDYMLMVVFEKLWPDMENPNATAIHKIHKGVDGGTGTVSRIIGASNNQ